MPTRVVSEGLKRSETRDAVRRQPRPDPGPLPPPPGAAGGGRLLTIPVRGGRVTVELDRPGDRDALLTAFTEVARTLEAEASARPSTRAR